MNDDALTEGRSYSALVKAPDIQRIERAGKGVSDMKAAIYTNYGSSEVVRIADVEKPVPRDNEVLIRVRAAAVNPLDWRLIKGGPLVVRIMFRLLRMPIGRPGFDVAGEVEAVGSKVTQFKPGDRVFGACRASIAEYACTPERAIAMKPGQITCAQAAASNVAGLTALQALRDRGKLRAGQKILVNGAAGGVGTFAVQLAKAFGAHVTGVCSSRNIEMVRSIGADEIVDYSQSNFAADSERYDLILECIGNHSFSECRQVLSPDGRFIAIGAPHDVSPIALLVPMIRDVLLSVVSSQKAVMFIAKPSQADLTLLGEYIVNGKLKPVIDKTYSLTDAAQAIGHVEQGHARGKVIIDVDRAHET